MTATQAPHGSRHAPAAAESESCSFDSGAVVQLASGDPGRSDALITTLHPATVKVTDRRVMAVVGPTEWSWRLDDVVRLAHGANGPWTIFDVPGVSDHGVAVRPDDVVEFRRHLDAALVRAVPAPPSGPAVRADDGVIEAFAVTQPVQVLPTPPVPAPPAPAPPAPAPSLLADRPDHPEADSTPSAPSPPLHPSSARGRTGRGGRLGRLGGRAGGAMSVHAPARSRPAATGDAPSTTRLAGLEAREISAWFGTHNVLDRVSLEMRAGEVTALIGPSGCGKSTFLRILNRMHEMIPSASLAGEVLLDGADIYDPERRLTDARRQIGMVFQKPNPFPAMSIYDNVVASLRLTGAKVGSEEKDHVVETCLSKAGLWTEVRDRLRQPGGGLSGGQQQRLCIARALAIRPRVLLMDEPCSALDPTSTRRIEQTITELADEVTIVIVTHNMQQAARVSHRCAFFLAEQGTPGVIVEHGPTEAMFGSPQDQRTSDYVNGRFG